VGNEQMHGIRLNAGSEEITVRHVGVLQTAGDGINLIGGPGNKVRKVWIDGCRLIQNKRTGVAFQRQTEFVWVRGCYIEMAPPSSDACIDFEPTGGAPGIRSAPSDIQIESNILVHRTPTKAVAIQGKSREDPARRVRFASNLVLGGELFCSDVEQLAIEHNAIVVLDADRRGVILLNVERGGREVLISGNRLGSVAADAPALISLRDVGRPVTRSLISGNLCSTRSRVGIALVSSADVAVERNLVVATGACRRGVLVHAEGSEVDRVAIQDNRITAADGGSWQSGVLFLVATGRRMHHVSATGNGFSRCRAGVEFGGDRNGFTRTPVCALNRTEGEVDVPLAGLELLPETAVIIGGAGAGRSLTGLGDPEGRVTGSVGDVYQRLDGSPGQTLFVKEAGQNTMAGWRSK
jgi:hypothetical protein